MDIQWPLVLFTLLTSMGGCLFVFVGINEFTKKSSVDGFTPGLVAIVLAIVGGLCSVLHLEHVDRMMNALSHPTSGIFVEAVLIGCLAVCVAVYLLCLKRKADLGVKVFAVLGAVFGIALSFMAGHSYIMAAVSTWNTMLLPTGYLFTALPMGAALYWALAGKEPPAAEFMAKALVICGVLGFIGTVAYAIASGAFLTLSAVIAVFSVILSGIVPTAIGYLSLKHMGADLPGLKAKEAPEADEAKEAGEATGNEAEKAADDAEAEKAEPEPEVEKVAEGAEPEAAAPVEAAAQAEAKADAPAEGTPAQWWRLEDDKANVWIAFASATLGALLYRVLMWTMYVAAYGFFGNNF